MAFRMQQGWMTPGFGLPLRWPDVKLKGADVRYTGVVNPLLASALDGSEDPLFCYTVRERTMISWINELTDMPDWARKIWDAGFVFQWKSAKVMAGGDVTRSMADWCVDEVRYYVQDFIRTGILPAVDGGVIKSDGCVNPSLSRELLKAVASIEEDSLPNRTSPREQIIDLVNPFLFPFSWDKTKVLRSGSVNRIDCISRCGEGVFADMPSKDECAQDEFVKYRNDMAWSRHYQWLPFDVSFGEKGEGPSQITSYINNVHPDTHFALYGVVERLIDTLIPFFNQILVDLKAPGYQPQRIRLLDYFRNPVIDRAPGPFRPPERRRQLNGYLDDHERYQSSIFVDLKKEFWNIGCQFILQIRDINLTAENPEYHVEDWQVQGQSNERICATAAYTYSTTNLSSTSPPTIAFRRRVNSEEAIAAKGEVTKPPFLPEIYGAKHGDPVLQTVGQVSLRESRLVMLPNVFQTRLQSFGLENPSKPGRCRILLLHLIDPNRRMLSTSNVPCQRRDWWAKSVRTTCARFRTLPEEIFRHIIEQVEDFPISTEEGERIRKNFKEERGAFRERHTKAMEGFEEWDFSGEPGVDDEDEEEDDPE